MIKVGPAGESKGVAWDESRCSDVFQIFIWHDDSCIRAIQFQYFENGNLLLSPKHGEDGGERFSTVKLHYPYEYITCVSGRCSVNGIASLSFKTNKGRYGPFGKDESSHRKFKLETGKDNQFGGFHGTYTVSSRNSNDKGIISIGVYVKLPNIKLPNIMSEDELLDHYLGRF